MTQPNTRWSHLPNAVHIDRVIASLKSHPEQWGKSNKDWSEVRSVGLQAEQIIVSIITPDVKREAAWNDLWPGPGHKKWNTQWCTGWSSLLCLVAYDDCAHMLEIYVSELRILAALGDEKAILMLPACTAFHSIKELENPNFEWDHLLNAVHIERILTSLKSHPEQWDVEWDENLREIWDITLHASSKERQRAWSSVCKVMLSTVRRKGVWNVAIGILLCLIAYDDCTYMLDSEINDLKILAALGDTRAMLILPACIVLHAIKELKHVN